jgi:signal transduction histidine kinase/uncharacterized protein YoaH (UPF0181 family)
MSRRSTESTGSRRPALEQPGATDLGELARLAEEQAALRRVATLVAGGASSADVFAAVAREVAQVMHLPNAAVCRYDDEGATMTILATWDDRPHNFQPGTRWPLDGSSVSAEILRTGRPARVEDYTDLPGSLAAGAREAGLTRTAGAPIIVGGRVWGLISTSSPESPLPDRVEDRLAQFTELVATAIANSQAREELTRLADEQSALLRVATLVAEGAPPAEVFQAVSVEVARLVSAEGAALTRYETDGTVTALGGWSGTGGYVHVGTRFALAGTVSGLVFETRRPERIDSYADAPGAAPDAAREMGWHSSVGVPITVEGRLWGVLAAVSRSDRPLPPDTERRLAEFTQLVATAIANAENRAELAASRARIVAAGDQARRRIERDLHDGPQQRLVSVMLDLRAAEAAEPPPPPQLEARLARVADGLAGALDDLRETSRGIHPAILSEGGLGAALKTLTRRSVVPVELDVQVPGRLPEPVETAAYYVVSEALTNAAKHAHASVIHVDVRAGDHHLHLSVRDDGVGGADPARGSGLIGLTDRVQALGGTITVRSPAEQGTTLKVELPAGPA